MSRCGAPAIAFGGTVLVGTVGQRQRIQILERDNYTCVYCGRRPPEVVLELDHVLPRSRGGSGRSENLATACRDCNQGKAAGLLRLPNHVVLERLPTPLQRRLRHAIQLEAEYAARLAARDTDR